MILNARGRGAWFRDEGYKLVLENMPDLTIIDPRYKLMKPGENEKLAAIVTFVSKQPAPMRKMALMEEIALDRHSSEAAVERALKKALVLNLLVERQEHVKGGGKLVCLP